MGVRGLIPLVVLSLTGGCAPGVAAPERLIGRSAPPSITRSPLTSEDESSLPTAETTTSSESAPVVPPEPEPTGPRVVVEPSYPWGEASPLPKSDLESANRGGEGTLTAERPKAGGHPHPRVIVDVPHVGGPHRQNAVVAKARSGSWHRIIRCYQADAYKKPDLEGEVKLRATVTGGGTLTKLGVSKSTFPKGTDVANCLTKKLSGIAMPQARKSSSAEIVIKLWPGDDPLPPPSDVDIERGDGVLVGDEVDSALLSQVDGFRACYEEALTSYAPELWGRLAMRVHVDMSGKVDEAFQVESAFPDEHVVRCALKHARTLQLPAPQSADVRWVLAFRLMPQ